ncbi:MAG: PEP/pyruvate-binding domain-containing protein [Acidobacteria bacterium]|nr:PEP/pyruvate-binding domain-containing protein [Acidobacteriota bacterium]MCA1642855.1 PEP/pyruvate-binding domain-containing protein [Acidobacteriota bacterium]
MRLLKVFPASLLLIICCAVGTAAQAGDEVKSLPAIGSQAEFDRVARVNTDTGYPLPHALFVVDRQDANKIYYVNSRRYRFHRDFVNGTYLSLDRGQDFFDKNYLRADRRFILGTLAYQTPLKRWTFEFWEGDTIPAEQVKLVAGVIGQTFFAPVAFKANSLRQEELASQLGDLPRVSQSEITREQEYVPLNLARGIGRVHVIKNLDEHVEIGENEILVLEDAPLHLPPVAGIITSKPSTPLAHINLLAKSWGVPNAYVKNAFELFKAYDTRWIIFETKPGGYAVKFADNSALSEYQKRVRERRDLMSPRFDLSVRRLASLSAQRARSVVAYGAKSANLGAVLNARIPGVVVPHGFTIPFYYYGQFVKQNKLEDAIYEMLDDQRFVHDPAYRRERLKRMRETIQNGKLDESLRREVVRRFRAEFKGRGVFVRSSTNTEDLPNFNGAGLYNTVPNVTDEDKLVEAIKNVWSSIWNFEAYEARERAGIDHAKVYPAVLIQEGVNADSAGVLITTDPYDRANSGGVYISAKRGLGIKVVEGKRVAEQIIYSPRSQAVRILTRSEEDSLLTFDERGGVKEIPITGDRLVLTDDTIRRLARAATRIKEIFGGREQDIEWVFRGNQLYIVQSRPYIAGS